MRYDSIIPFTSTICDRNTIDIRTVYEQNDHEYVIGTVKELSRYKIALIVLHDLIRSMNNLIKPGFMLILKKHSKPNKPCFALSASGRSYDQNLIINHIRYVTLYQQS